jgi:hypothetical protein
MMVSIKQDIVGVNFNTDETWFQLFGYVSQNNCIWSAINTYRITDTPLHDEKDSPASYHTIG